MRSRNADVSSLSPTRGDILADHFAVDALVFVDAVLVCIYHDIVLTWRERGVPDEHRTTEPVTSSGIGSPLFQS